ncbi:MAG: DUF1849 family protein [Rhizobiales bacterium]|nr:DUF1849 family protein [Hyphomicrobiales bacterium]
MDFSTGTGLRSVVLSVLVWGLFCSPVLAGAVDQTRMHRAVYDLSVGRQDIEGDQADLSGRMVVDWRGGPSCGGYTMDQRFVTLLADETGSVSSDLRLSTWEAADFHEFHYERIDYTNGAVSDSAGGVAIRDAKTGVITVDQEGADPVTLPKGTLFPSQYNFALMDAINAGKKSFTGALFDGTELHASEVTAFFGRPEKTEDAVGVKITGDGKEPLKSVAAWPIFMSYFDPDNNEGTPSFEMRFSLFPNGVSSDIVFIYSDMDMRGRLVDVNYYKPGAC